MGKKNKSKSKKKRSDSFKTKKSQRKLISRKEAILSNFEPALLDLMFKSKDEQMKFANFLIEQERLDDMIYEKEFTSSGIANRYQEKLDKLMDKPLKQNETLWERAAKIAKLEHKIKKAKKFSKLHRKKDLSLASYLNPARYSKKMLNKNKYRKELKKLAKLEKAETKEMERLGIIKKSNVDENLKKLLAANNMMETALNDAYSQKHFIDE